MKLTDRHLDLLSRIPPSPRCVSIAGLAKDMGLVNQTHVRRLISEIVTAEGIGFETCNVTGKGRCIGVEKRWWILADQLVSPFVDAALAG